MKMIWLRTRVLKYTKVDEFLSEFNVGKGDLIFTHEFIYKPIIAPYLSGADTLFLEKFGLGEPSSTLIDKIFIEIKDKRYKRIIAIGGGSVIDVAKLLVLDVTAKTVDLFDKKVPLVKKCELIIVPTTCGTGSEVTNLSIVEIVEKKTKMGLSSDEMFADYAVLIPDLLKTLPYDFFIYSSIDALIHAAESYVSPNSNEYTELFSISSIKKILSGYAAIVKKGKDFRFEILEEFLVASNFAGVAFGNTGAGAVHALSYPLGGNYHVPHGEANYQFFTEIFKLYKNKKPQGKIKVLIGIIAEILDVDESLAFTKMDELLMQLIAKKKLREYGMKEHEIAEFTDSVIKNQQRLLKNNYVELKAEEIEKIYAKLY
jgi:4-hydroxybutyrate dehydrogenase